MYSSPPRDTHTEQSVPALFYRFNTDVRDFIKDVSLITNDKMLFTHSEHSEQSVSALLCMSKYYFIILYRNKTIVWKTILILSYYHHES
jgi:hypothetical protein